MKLLKVSIFSLFCFLFVFNPFTRVAFADDSTTSDREISFSGGDEDTVYVDRILRYAFKEMGYNLSLKLTGTESATTSANLGVSDGLLHAPKGLENEYKNLVMVNQAISSMSYVVFSKDGNEIPIKNWDKLANKKIGYVVDDPYLKSRLPANLQASIQYPDKPTMYQAILNGEIDLAIITQASQEILVMPDGIISNGAIEILPTYPYLNKKNSNLLPQLEKVLTTMNYEGIFQKIRENKFDLNQSKNKIILTISSFSSDVLWERNLFDGFRVPLENGIPTEVFNFSINALHLKTDSTYKKNIANIIQRNFIDKVPDLIIVSDDEAFNFLKEYYSTTFAGIPVVFCSVNNFTPESIKGLEDTFTGVAETSAAEETVDEMLRLYPKTKKIFVVTDYTLSGKAWRGDIENQLSSYKDRVDIEYNDNLPFNELIEKIKTLPDDTLMLCGFYLVDGANKYQILGESQKAFATNFKGAIFGLYYPTYGQGQLGGKYSVAGVQVKYVREIASKILEGVPVSDIPVIYDCNKDYPWIFDYFSMKKFGIKESQLPPSSLVDKKPKSLFETYPLIVITAIIIMSLTIIGFLVFFTYTQRRKNTLLLTAQQSLHTAQTKIEKDKVVLQAKEFRNQILETAPVAFAVISDGIVREANAYAESTWGIAIGDQLEKCFADKNQLNSILHNYKTANNSDGEVAEFIITTGATRRFFITMSSLFYEGKNCDVMWAIDVEDNEQQHNLLKKLQADLQSVLDSLPLGVLISSLSNAKPIYMNTAYLKIFKFKSHEFGLKYSKLELSPEFQPDGNASAQLIKSFVSDITSRDETISYEWQFALKNKNVLETKIYDRKIFYNGEEAIVSIIQDITTDKQQSEMLLRTAEKEREANQIKSRFVINMSHEIRTPMNAVIGLSEIALMKNFNKEADNSFRKINTSAKNLLSIINDVLDFSKIEAKKLELFEEEFVLEETLANASLMASQRIGAKQVEMLLQLDVSIPSVLYGDKTRLWQILKNLLDNSAKFTNQGHIVLSATHNPALTTGGKTLITFTVMDTGFGMSQEQLDKLYVPFEQFHRSLANTSTGTGLGMTITKQLVELMGGTLKVESQTGVGTTTTVIIPLKAATKDGLLKDALVKDSLKGKRVLVADDDPISLEIMDYLMKSVEIIPTCVARGTEAIALAKQAERDNKPYDIILLDYKMDGLNGIEVSRQLKNAVSDNNAKILMVSAYSSQLVSGNSAKVDFDEIIEKPYSPTEFIQKLYNALFVKKATLKATTQTRFDDAAVLVVEDNIINQEVAESMLEIFGIKPVMANNGQEALDILEKQPFQLILMDLLMPVMNGHEATKTIRQSDKPYKNVPIVAMTANVVKEEIDACMAEGMNGHIGKPVDINVLGVHLSKWLTASKEAPPEPTRIADDKKEVTGIDFDSGVARFAGKKDRYIKVLIAFAKQFPEQIMPFEEAVNEENLKQTAALVHNIKGTAGNLSIINLYEAAIAFENTIRSNQPDKDLYNELFACYTQVHNEILEVYEN